MLINIKHPTITSIEVINISELKEVLKLFEDKTTTDLNIQLEDYIKGIQPYTIPPIEGPITITYNGHDFVCKNGSKLAY